MMHKRDLSRLLRPRSIALIGGVEASEALRQCRLLGFEGDIWRIHPEKQEDQGVKCIKDVADLPSPPDASWIGVNREATIGVVKTLADMGAGGAISYASGFNETSDDKGDSLTQALLDAAGDMPLVGPNCYGLVNYLDGALCWPDQQGGERLERGVALLCQSSNIAMNMTMQRRGTPFAYIAALGNQIQIDFCDIAESLLDDKRVTAIGLHIEGIRDIGKFARLARKARESNIPVVAITVGKSEQARVAKLSHTASLTGEHRIMEAFFEKIGIPLLPSLPSMLETLKLLHAHGALNGRDICSFSCSGGEAALMGDAALEHGLNFRALDASAIERVKATTHPLVHVANPLDYHTFDWGKEERLRATFAAMLEERFDLSLLVLDFPHPQRCVDANWMPAVRALRDASAATNAPCAVVATLHENMLEHHARDLLKKGIAPLCGIDDALTAVDAAARITQAWRKPFPEDMQAPARLSGEATLLDEWDAKRLLKNFALPVPEAEKLTGVKGARAAAEKLGYPVVAKALGLAHKSEHQAVRLNIRNAEELEEAVETLLPLGKGVLVEQMIEGAVAEMILGILADPDYGQVMSIGAGGIWTEMLADTRLVLLPARREDIAEAVAGLRIHPLLQGARGGRRADIDAIIDAAMSLQAFALEHRGSLAELDINPLLVRAEDSGVVVADALVRVHKQTEEEA